MKRQDLLNQIGDGFGQLKRAMHVYAADHFTDISLSPAQVGLLKVINCQGPLSHKALAKATLLTPGAVTQLMDGLYEADCVVRSVSEADRRVSYVSISRSGKQKLADYDVMRAKLLAKATADISDAELEAYSRVQQTLITWFEKQ